MKLNYTSTEFVAVKDIEIPDIYNRRLKTGIETVDTMFGDGLLPGSVITLSSKAGMGKTTFVLQMLNNLTKFGHRIGFCSSEESIFQVAFACRRLGITEVGICNESRLDKILTTMENMSVVVVDSFQGIDKCGMDDKDAIEALIQKAKATECVLILICHLTKSGDMRGTNLLTYAVDVNMFLDSVKDAPAGTRHVYFSKNRFGPGAEFDIILEKTGFDFTAIQPSGTEKKKVNKKDEERKKILALTGKITVEKVCKAAGVDASRAGYLLRELTAEGKLKRKGKRKNVSWVNNEVQVEITDFNPYNNINLIQSL
jgi:predicted ATP-dependent serine protease